MSGAWMTGITSPKYDLLWNVLNENTANFLSSSERRIPEDPNGRCGPHGNGLAFPRSSLVREHHLWSLSRGDGRYSWCSTRYATSGWKISHPIDSRHRVIINPKPYPSRFLLMILCHVIHPAHHPVRRPQLLDSLGRFRP